MTLTIPEMALVLLVGASGSGKSTFARAHFKPTEVLSSDFCRAIVADDENDLSVTSEAFEVLNFIAAKRLAGGRLTVVDATNVQPEARRPLVALARKYHCLPVAIVFDVAERICQERNRGRTDRRIPAGAIHRQVVDLRRSLGSLEREGFHAVWRLNAPDDVASATIQRQRLWTNLRHEHGPFDIVGDVHGCYEELITLLERLGYHISAPSTACHPEGRKVIILGDLVDRGPDTPDVLRLVMSMVESGVARCIPGNHDVKLLRRLKGREVKLTHGLSETMAQLEQEPADFVEGVKTFLDGLVSHYVLDEGRLVVAHAGMKAEMQGRASREVRDFALYGETTGETDEFGLPVRVDWAEDYRGHAIVIYGHTPVLEPKWVNRTINIDTGCVFGGRLTALRYPERELVSITARRVYYEPARPLVASDLALPDADPGRGDLLDLDDVVGKRFIDTRLYGRVTIREDQASAALEVMSRFAVDPRWLVYLPPTMSPTETADIDELLEHPAQALAYYRDRGIPEVICEEKHMGSRAVVIVCRDAIVAQSKFGVTSGEAGICYTRTGRRFFSDHALEIDLLDRVRRALDTAGLWNQLDTGWCCFDCELTPWSFKAEALIREQYASVGVAGQAALSQALSAIEQAEGQGIDARALVERYRLRQESIQRYVEAYRRYCWPATSVNDLRLAPFHVLATEGAVHTDKDHVWHMNTIAKACAADAAAHPDAPVLQATTHHVVDLTDTSIADQVVRWWEDLTAGGGEGIVVKPLSFLARGDRGLLQPAIKCRGRDYLRIIYGPEYALPENLERLRRRGLGRKRSLAVREFALGVEALTRFVSAEPLYRIHECVFGVLALESEPVDPRL